VSEPETNGKIGDRSLMSNVDIVRAMFESYLAQDRGAADQLLAQGFVFTSPQDDHIDRAAFFDRCFPTAARFVSQELVHAVPTTGDEVFVIYDYELRTGEHHRNVEMVTVGDDRITETQAFFVGPLR
jgi:ketosteroid isomerase-like protein